MKWGLHCFLIVIAVLLISCEQRDCDKKVVGAINELVKGQGINSALFTHNRLDNRLLRINNIERCIIRTLYSDGHSDSANLYFDTLGRVIIDGNPFRMYHCGSVDLTKYTYYENNQVNTIHDYNIYCRDTLFLSKEKYDREGRLLYIYRKSDSVIRKYSSNTETIIIKEGRYIQNIVKSFHFNNCGIIDEKEEVEIRSYNKRDSSISRRKEFFSYNNKKHELYRSTEKQSKQYITYSFDSTMNVLRDRVNKYGYNKEGKLISREALDNRNIEKWKYDSLSRLIYNLSYNYRNEIDYYSDFDKVAEVDTKLETFYKYNSIGLIDTARAVTSKITSKKGIIISKYTQIKVFKYIKRAGF